MDAASDCNYTWWRVCCRSLICNANRLPCTWSDGREIETRSMYSPQRMEKVTYPDSEVYGANMGSTWGQQDPGGPDIGPVNLATWDVFWPIWRSLTVYVKKTIFLRELIQLCSSLQISNLSPECHYDWLIYLLKNRWKMIHSWNHSAVQYYADSNVIAVNMPVFSSRDNDSYTRLYLY